MYHIIYIKAKLVTCSYLISFLGNLYANLQMWKKQTIQMLFLQTVL